MKESKYLYQRWMSRKILQDVETSVKVLDSYNKTRFNRRKGKKEDLLIESAKYAHNNSIIYFVTKFINEHPICHLEINKDFFRVIFLDKLKRGYLSYDFVGNDDLTGWRNEIDSEKLFLSSVVEKQFQNDSDKIIASNSYIFRPDGSFTIVERNHLTNEQIDKVSKSKVDISANWEDYPEFGEYDKLTRSDREINL